MMNVILADDEEEKKNAELEYIKKALEVLK